MTTGHVFTKNELEKILQSVKGKTLGEVDVNHVFSRTKTNPKITGIAGDVIEQSVLGYSANSSQTPDLIVDGIEVELKTTGVRQKEVDRKKIFVAKEPSSITAVSLDKIASEVFESSNFWHKAENLLFVFYWYTALETVLAERYSEFPIQGYIFHKFSDDDIEILKNDWQLIHDFIENIQKESTEDEAKERYPDLSTIINKQTVYLDTAPKYPHSPRFRLRRRVVDLIVDKALNHEEYEQLPNRYTSLSDLEKKCVDLTNQYSGQTLAEILTGFGINFDSKKEATSATVKQFAEQVIVRMFGGLSKKISKIDLFRKFGFVAKTVTLNANGGRTEDMKLLAVDFGELADSTIPFEETELYSYFHDYKFLCIIFKERKLEKGEKVKLADNEFVGFKILTFDDAFISEVKKSWDDARNTIFSGNLRFIYDLDKNGNKIKNPKSNTYKGAPNLPKSEQFTVFFRGTGQTAKDKVNVLGVEMLRQNYWIKGTFIVDALKHVKFIGE